MTDFSVPSAAFTGFRVVRDHPIAVPAWIFAALAFHIITQVILGAVGGQGMMQLQTMGVQGLADPGKLAAAYLALLPAYLILMPISIAFNALIGAAMIRAVTRPGQVGFGYFRLGADELRQLGLNLLLIVIYMAVGAVIGAALVIGGRLAKGAAVGVHLLVATIGVLAIGYLAVKLSLASADTFRTRRINLVGSWGLTRGRFWKLCGVYALAGVMILMVSTLWLVLIGALSGLVVVMGAGPLLTAANPAFGPMATALKPAGLLGACLGGLLNPMMLTPAASVYQQIAGRFDPSVAEAFD